jgi:hypothetical protein
MKHRNASGIRSSRSVWAYCFTFAFISSYCSHVYSDKYVTRVEYDQLKARVDQLELLVGRLTGNQAITSPSLSMAAGPMSAYMHSYRPPSVLSGTHHSAAESHSESYSRRMSSIPSSHGQISGDLTSSPVNRDAVPVSSRMHPPAQMPHAARQLPPSLAAITTPFELNPDDGSKKPNAQTFIWQGERLRQLFQAYGLAPLRFNRDRHHPSWIQLPSPQPSTVTLLYLLSVIVRSAILLLLCLYLSALGTLQGMLFRLHRLVVNAPVDPKTPLVLVGDPGSLFLCCCCQVIR